MSAMKTDSWWVSDGRSEYNEDACRESGNRFWILDGATSLSGRVLRGRQGELLSDAAWFVRSFSEALAGLPHTPVPACFASALARSRADLSESAAGWGDRDVPSASFLHAEVTDGGVELCNLGDCKILYRSDGGRVTVFGDSPVERLDRRLLESYLALRRRQPDASHADLWRQLVPSIRAHRRLMNTRGGYWILDPSGRGLPCIEVRRVEFRRSFEGLLVTDGLLRLIDTYRLMTVDDLFAVAATAGGLDRLVDDLRGFEASDPGGEKRPRVKLQDDATALWFAVTIPGDAMPNSCNEVIPR